MKMLNQHFFSSAVSSTNVVVIIVVTCTIIVSAVFSPRVNEQERDPAFWTRIGQEELSRALKRQPINKRARNVILLVADGMGVSTVTAARIFHGQRHNSTGEEGLLSFERFPNIAHAKTYNVDKQTPDSAGTATAFLCGVKNNYGTIGVDATVTRRNCSGQKGHHVDSILHWSLQAGKAVGVVSNTRVTHATPAATFAHSADRNWESDVDMEGEEKGCKDIARQLIEDNPDIKVILGGGRYNFLPHTEPDPESGERNVNRRLDGRNLVQAWLDDKRGRGVEGRYVWNASALNSLDLNSTHFLLGLFDSSHMAYEYVRTSEPDPIHKEAGEPSLADMTRAAIQLLQKEEKGYFLFVEGGRIDHAHHSNRAKLSLVETLAFDDAVRVATEMTSQEDTLVVVTADHSHVFVIGGYPTRGNSITGEEDVNLAGDHLPFTTLLYGNGPGYSHHNGSREDIAYVDVEDIFYRQQAAVPLTSETHAGEDVAIYARGPMGHLFHATHEQSYLAYVMAYASCVGVYADLHNCAAALEETEPVAQADAKHGPASSAGRKANNQASDQKRRKNKASTLKEEEDGEMDSSLPLREKPTLPEVDAISGGSVTQLPVGISSVSGRSVNSRSRESAGGAGEGELCSKGIGRAMGVADLMLMVVLACLIFFM